MKFRWFHKKQQKEEPRPFRVAGITDAPITPVPDDAELAAEALMDSLASAAAKPQHSKKGATAEPPHTEKGTVAYYEHLAEKIRSAHITAAQHTTRFVAWVEEELKKPNLPMNGPGSLPLLEAELYKRIDTVEREGGELKQRWQHCLAEVTVRIMEKTNPNPYREG